MAPRRRFTGWLALALFAAPALVGHGLHLVPGLGHGLHLCGPKRSVATRCCNPACCAHRTERPVGWQASTAADGGQHVCPICQFFATSKIADTPAEVVLFTAVVAEVLPAARFVVGHRAVRPLGPRGPPVV